MKDFRSRRVVRFITGLAGALFLALASVQPGLAQSGITGVWAVDDGEKVRRDDLNHWAASSPHNAVWDGSTIRLFGARNEIIAFQLILEARGSGAGDVDVSLDSLVGPGYVIANRSTSNDPFDYRGRHIELFLEHYINVTQRSMSGDVSCWVDARPIPDSDFLGWIPDALVPFQATPGTADWIGGAPFAISGGRNQAVWVDITIPRDAPPGTYRTTVRVSEQGHVTYAIPLELLVYGFTLPDSTHFHNTFYIENKLLTRHPGVTIGSDAYWEMFQKYMHLAHRHRMDLTDGRLKLNAFEADLKEYYTGSRYTEQFGYDGPGLGVGNATYSIGTYDQPNNGYISGFGPPTREVWQAASDAWESWFRSNAPDVVRFKYMVDEPDRDTAQFYGIVRERAAWIRENPGPGKDLGIFCTVKLDRRLEGSVDFWSTTGQSGADPGDGIGIGYRIQKADQRRALGERVGIYNGTRPSFGIFEWIDNVATDPRVDPWIAFKYDVDQFFLWETGQIYNQTILEKQNPWRTPYQIYPEGKVRWGHGTVLYTGDDALFPEESRGVNGPIASIRIKNWRRGQQDYEYLLLARQAGVDEDVLNAVVPAALDDYKGTYTSPNVQPVFAQRGYVFERERRRLADRIDRGSRKNLSVTVRNSSGPEDFADEGMVYLRTWRQEPADSCPILGNGVAMFVDVPADTGYCYRVYRTSVSGARPLGTEYWGMRRGLTIEAGQSVADQFIRHMPRTANIHIYDEQTGQDVTRGVVAPGTALQLTVAVSNPSSPGAGLQSVKSRGVLDRDMAPPFDIDLMDSAYQPIAVGSIQSRRFSFTPTGESDYYGVTGTLTDIGGSPVCTQSGTWTAPLLRVVARPPAPALVYPADSATGVGGNPLLIWSHSEGATAYHLIVSLDSFAHAVTDTVIPDTMFTLPLLQPLTGYRWKVAGIGITGEGPFAPSRAFTTFLGPPAPALVYPADTAAGVEENPVLVWNRADQATGYHLTVSQDSLFATALADSIVPDTTFALPPLQPLSRYWWRVASIGIIGEGPFTPVWRFTTRLWLGVPDASLPREFSLQQNYPNPFNPSTTIRYGLPTRALVTLAVFNALGQRVAVLVQAEQEAGYHAVRFTPNFASGVYLYRLQAGDFVQTRRLLLVR